MRANPGAGLPDRSPPLPRTFTYVISSITLDEARTGSSLNPAVEKWGVTGFNLDGLTSTPADVSTRDTACFHADYFSALDPDQNLGVCIEGFERGGADCSGGVDNQLPELARILGGFHTDLRASLNNDLHSGLVAILVRVSEVDGTPGPTLNDNSVRVHVYPIARPMFANCVLMGTPGQAFAVDDASLRTPGDIDSARLFYEGSIANGRLRVTRPTDPSRAPFLLRLPVMGEALQLPLLATEIRFDLLPDRGTRGNLGGYVRLESLAASFSAHLPAGIPSATVQSVFQSLVDVQDPAGSPAGCVAPNGGVSVGFGFDAVRAILAPETVHRPQAGMCGAAESAANTSRAEPVRRAHFVSTAEHGA